jgi:hypothetical protein
LGRGTDANLPTDAAARDALTDEVLPLANSTLRLPLLSLGWRVVWVRREGE